MTALLAAALGLGTVAEAQDDADAEARGLFLAGQAAFEAARYEDALAHFRAAYERSARPELLYNVAIAADRLRRDDEALEAFERFLAEAPEDAPQRRDVEARAEVLRRAIAARREEASDPEPETEPAPAPEVAPGGVARDVAGDDGASIGGWSLVAGGAAVAITGAILLGVGRSEAARVESASPGTPWLDVAGSAALADQLTPAGIAVLAVGVLASGAGALWLGLAPEREHEVRVGLGLGGLRIEGTL